MSAMVQSTWAAPGTATEVLTGVAWRHVASPDPSGGAENEALLQSAEFERSDVGLVGLMMRCHQGRVEPVVILLDPLPPGTPARITWTMDGFARTFASSPIPTGAGLSVPLSDPEIATLGTTDAPTVEISVEQRGEQVRGAVSLAGLKEPLDALRQACAAKPLKSDRNP